MGRDDPAPTEDRYRRWGYLLLVPLGLGTIGLFYTFSRSAQLALAAGVTLMLITLWLDREQRRARLRLAGIALAVMLGALILPSTGNQRLIAQRAGQDGAFTENVGETRSLVERDVLAESANRVFYQRQLLGVGNGALALGMYYLDKEFPGNEYDYQPVHLVVLNAAAELGILGGFLWLWLMVLPLCVMWIRRSYLIGNPWTAAVCAAVIMILIVGFFDYYPWFWQSGRLWQWSIWGLFAAVFVVRKAKQSQANHYRGVNE